MLDMEIARWRSITQVVREANVSASRIRDLIDAGRLRAVKTELGWLIDPASLAEWQTERETAQWRIARERERIAEKAKKTEQTEQAETTERRR